MRVTILTICALSTLACERPIEPVASAPTPATPTEPSAPVAELPDPVATDAFKICSTSADCDAQNEFCDDTMCASCCPPGPPGEPRICNDACCGHCIARDSPVLAYAGEIIVKLPEAQFGAGEFVIDVHTTGVVRARLRCDKPVPIPDLRLRGSLSAGGAVRAAGTHDGVTAVLEGQPGEANFVGTLVVTATNKSATLVIDASNAARTPFQPPTDPRGDTRTETVID